MSIDLDRAGVFKARMIEWGVRGSDTSRAVAITARFTITDYLDQETGEWDDWTKYEEMQVRGDFWVVKKDGTLNSTTIESVVRATGWDGSMRSVSRALPPRSAVQLVVESDSYKGRERFRVKWMNPFDYSPGPDLLDDSKTAKLDTMFGSEMRALAANVNKAEGSPSKPTKPPARRASKKAEPEPESSDDGSIPAGALEADGDDTPF